MKIDLVVSRHLSLIEYLREINLFNKNTKIVSHVNADMVKDKVVCGVLPHSLSALCDKYIEIPLNVPQELRGKELYIEQIRKFAGKPVVYNNKIIEILEK